MYKSECGRFMVEVTTKKNKAGKWIKPQRTYFVDGKPFRGIKAMLHHINTESNEDRN